MPLSNYVSSSRISQPGVCTSNTRPVTPYEGQVIYETDTNRTLIWNNSAWISPNSTTSNPPGLEYIGSWSAISGTSLELTDCFSAAYANYQLNINGYANPTTYAALNINFGGSNSGYKLGGQYWPTLASSGISRYGSGITTVATGALGFITASGSKCGGTVMIYDPFTSGQTTYVAQSSHAVSDNAVGPSWVAGWHAISQSNTYCTISVTAGSFQNIECHMYGYRN
jgi:hypothetical protein